ncbi:MAG: hypothetical protein AAGE98_04785 [Actinomycetota bacterium]
MEHGREKLLAHGLAQLAAHGVEIGMSTVSLALAAEANGMSLADAEALWGAGDVDPWERYREAVAVRVLEEQPAVGDDGSFEGTALTETLVAVSTMIEDMPDLAELSPAERGHWLRRIYRAGTDANLALADESLLWRSYVAIGTVALSQPSAGDALRSAWSKGHDTSTTRYLNVYSVLASMFGLRLRYAYTWPQFTTAVSALSEGLMIRSNVREDTRSIERRSSPDGEAEQWTLFAVCFEALVNQFFEPDPAAEIVTDLSHEGIAQE